MDELALRKNIVISTVSRTTENILGNIKVQLISNSSHIMCNENGDLEPQVIKKNSNFGKLLCKDEDGIFTSFNYKPIKL